MRVLSSRATLLAPLVAGALALAATSTLAAQNQAVGAASSAKADPITAEGYIAPPEAIAKLVTAPRELNASFTSPSPGARKWVLRTVSDGLPTLELVGKAHYNLGGLQIDHRAGRERTMTHAQQRRARAPGVEHGAQGADQRAGRRARRRQQLVAGRLAARVLRALPRRDAHLRRRPGHREVARRDGATRPRDGVTSFEWTADGRSLVTVLVPAGRGAEPREPAIATAPQVRVNESSRLKTRTYADLVASPFEKSLLEYHTTGQLAVIDTRTRAIRTIGAPGMLRSINPSPEASSSARRTPRSRSRTTSRCRATDDRRHPGRVGRGGPRGRQAPDA
jgi:hypothetical protein